VKEDLERRISGKTKWCAGEVHEDRKTLECQTESLKKKGVRVQVKRAHASNRHPETAFYRKGSEGSRTFGKGTCFVDGEGPGDACQQNPKKVVSILRRAGKKYD